MSAPGSRPAREQWFPFGTQDDARVRLVCCPHAGAGASTFLPWRRHLAPDVGVCPVQLPGRETRIGEPPYRRTGDLVADLLPILLPLTDRPVAIFGHSLGALLAFEIARAMRAAALPSPAHLFVSGRAAPQIENGDHRVLHALSDQELVSALGSLGGTPKAVLADSSVMAKVLPMLRADLELNENYVFRDESPLAVPVTVFASDADPRATTSESEAWSAVAAGPFAVRHLVGDHFAVFERVDEVLPYMAAGLSRSPFRGGAVPA